jgi:hypothetical protein
MTMTYAQPLTRSRNRFVVPSLWRQVFGGAAKETVSPEPDRSAYTQLDIYEGLLRAFDRRAEVLAAIAAAPEREISVRRVRELLEVTYLQATAVVDFPPHAFTDEARDRIARRAAELRTALSR